MLSSNGSRYGMDEIRCNLSGATDGSPDQYAEMSQPYASNPSCSRASTNCPLPHPKSNTFVCEGRLNPPNNLMAMSRKSAALLMSSDMRVPFCEPVSSYPKI